MTKTKKTSSFIKSGFQLFIIVILLGGIFFLLVNIYRSVQKYRIINKEINKLEEEANKFDQENKKLNKLVQYFSSDNFQEKEIKEKLNLVKEGEKVVFVQNDDRNLSEDIAEKKAEIKIKHANYYYWWRYFFGKR